VLPRLSLNQIVRVSNTVFRLFKRDSSGISLEHGSQKRSRALPFPGIACPFGRHRTN